MHIAIPLNQCILSNIYIQPTVQNIMMDGSFNHLLYSDDTVSLQGLCLLMPFQLNAEFSGKYRPYPATSMPICNLEQQLLKMYSAMCAKPLTPTYKIREIMQNGIYISGGKSTVVCHITGVWSNANCCGLTFKFS